MTFEEFVRLVREYRWARHRQDEGNIYRALAVRLGTQIDAALAGPLAGLTTRPESEKGEKP